MKFPAIRVSAKPIAALTAALLLVACGGGGGGDGGGGGAMGGEPIPTSDDFIRLIDRASTGETPLGYVAINMANAKSSGFAGMLDHDAGTVNGGLLAGTINNGRTNVSLSNGNSATLTNPANTLHLRTFNTSGLSNDRFGVVGQFTEASDTPDMGSSTYNGSVILQADNGTSTFALTGDARITVGWDATNSVTSVFNDLDGRKNDIQNVNNVGTVTITGATVTGSTFSGGTFSTTGSELAYSGGGTRVHEGQFFGPEATEVGGVFGLKKASELELSGIFIAKGGLD